MGLFQMRVSCLLLMTVHQVTGIGMITFSSGLTKNKMKRSDIGAGATCSTPGQGTCDHSKSFTFAQAEKVCADNNKRLCTKEEVKANKCCDKGAGSCDEKYIWTSTSESSQYWIERGCPRKCESKDYEMEEGKFADSVSMTTAGVQCCDQGQNTQAHYILGEDNVNKCPEGSTKIQTEAECKAAASELGKGQWGWNGAKSKANKPSKCWKGASGNANWNPHAVGSAASGRHPICKQASEGSSNTSPSPPAENTQGDTPDESVSINMGGAKRKDDNTNVYRPEAVHSEVCDKSLNSKACKPCTSKTECWHGVDPNAMGINVPKGKAGFEYVAKIWASCTTKEGYWRVMIENLQNANIKVYLKKEGSDTHKYGQEVSKTIMKDSLYGDKVHYEMKHTEIGKNAQISIVLSPNAGTSLSQDSAGPAAAKIVIMAMANAWVDACMDRTYCLKRVGDGSAAAFKLRNSNRAQYDCLKGPFNPQAGVCGAWRTCFASQQGTTNHEKELLALLSAVFKKATSSLVKTKLLGISSSGQIDEEGCADPETDDPEAEQCECFDAAKKQCDEDGVTDSEECFRTLLCAHDQVCKSWRDEHCGEDSLLMRRGSRRSGMATTANGTRTIMAITAHDTLDDSLTGKCTSSTK